MRTALAGAALAGLVGLAGPVVAGCSAAPVPDAPPATTEPPAPPAACLLDTGALQAATGLAWTPDATTAGDARCVYDPASGTGAEFAAVDVAPRPSGTLDDIAALCAAGSRTPASTGFVCRLEGGGVFAATDRGSDLVTLAVATVPEGTTAAQLTTALAEQIALLGG